MRLLEPWRSRLLWLSLGLNVFAAALLVTLVVWHPHGPDHPGPPGFDTLVQRISRNLDPGGRRGLPRRDGQGTPLV